MSRQRRIEYPGAIYHVMSRGKRRERIFRDEADRRLFRAALEGTVSIVRTDTCLFLGESPASIHYWDPQTNNSQIPYLGSMAGSWDDRNWSLSASGEADPTRWVNGDAVCFGVNTGSNTPPFAVVMNSDHIVAGMFNGPLKPNSCDVTLYGSGVMTLPAGLDAFAIRNASDGSVGIVTISNTIAGPGVLTLTGNGQLYLCGSNTWTGGTFLGVGYNCKDWEGTIYFNAANAFGSGPICTRCCPHASLVMTGSSPLVITNPVFFATPVDTLLNLVGGSAGVTFAGPWTLGQPAMLGIGDTNGANHVTISGVISGLISGRDRLTITNASENEGILTLDAHNTYQGNTTIGSGTLAIGANGSISNTPMILVGEAGRFDVSAAAPFGINGGQTLEGYGQVAGDISIGAGASIAGGTSGRIGTLTGSGTLLLQSGGTNREYIQNALTGAGVGNSSLAVGQNIGVLASGAKPFTIKLISLSGTGEAGLVSNFDRTMTYSWTVASGAVTNFDASAFVVDTSAFANRAGGTFWVSNTGTALLLNYQP